MSICPCVITRQPSVVNVHCGCPLSVWLWIGDGYCRCLGIAPRALLLKKSARILHLIGDKAPHSTSNRCAVYHIVQQRAHFHTDVIYLAGVKEGSKSFMILRVKPKRIRFPANSLYIPLDKTTMHSISSVCHPWDLCCPRSNSGYL